jgi:hypothetical protein
MKHIQQMIILIQLIGFFNIIVGTLVDPPHHLHQLHQHVIILIYTCSLGMVCVSRNITQKDVDMMEEIAVLRVAMNSVKIVQVIMLSVLILSMPRPMTKKGPGQETGRQRKMEE